MKPNDAIALGALAGLWLGWTTAGRGEKTPDVRYWDVLALGPWLILLAARPRTLSKTQRVLLAIAGGATIAHNGRNMLVRATDGT